MRIRFTLFYLLSLLSLGAAAQDVTGIWRGYFIQNTFGIYEDRYKFEVQIEQLPNHSINGVTYSYKTTVFYGKATLQGIYTKKTRNLIIKEIKLVDVKISGQSSPCLMTCVLDYDKMGKMETLTGTYTSVGLNTNKDCGSGKVFLERVPTSDFYKEDFLVERENKQKQKPPSRTPQRTRPDNSTAARPNTTTKKPVKPGAEENLLSKENTKQPVFETPKVEETVPTPPVEIRRPPKPEIMKQRSNDLVKAIYTSAKQIKVQLYDNGEIDGDTISVYHNNQLIISKQRLTDKPITFTINADEGTWQHEFVMVADNLGSIPPNTALMVITAGNKRYELFITSNEKKNAVVQLEYRPEK